MLETAGVFHYVLTHREQEPGFLLGPTCNHEQESCLKLLSLLALVATLRIAKAAPALQELLLVPEIEDTSKESTKGYLLRIATPFVDFKGFTCCEDSENSCAKPEVWSKQCVLCRGHLYCCVPPTYSTSKLKAFCCSP